MKTVLVTGGTGTLGHHLVPLLLKDLNIRVRILSRCEHRQSQLKRSLGNLADRVDFFVGDVRDAKRVWYATRGVDMVFHLAALKSVDKAEYNPSEAISVNITGSQNVVDACIENGVKTAIITSTDKAVEPLNIYGASKLAAERLFVESNAYSGEYGTAFIGLRYGNVLGSNGSVLQVWKKSHILKVTHPDMTRFFITAQQAAEFVLEKAMACYHNPLVRGEVFIPNMKSCTLLDLAEVCHDVLCKPINTQNTTRPGEKMHESLFGKEEAELMSWYGGDYIRVPKHPMYQRRKLVLNVAGELSSKNADRFDRQTLKSMIVEALCT